MGDLSKLRLTSHNHEPIPKRRIEKSTTPRANPSTQDVASVPRFDSARMSRGRGACLTQMTRDIAAPRGRCPDGPRIARIAAAAAGLRTPRSRIAAVAGSHVPGPQPRSDFARRRTAFARIRAVTRAFARSEGTASAPFARRRTAHAHIRRIACNCTIRGYGASAPFGFRTKALRRLRAHPNGSIDSVDSPVRIRTEVAGSKVPHDWPLHYGARWRPRVARPRF